MSRNHWRSLDQLEDTPEARAFREREFPEGASEPPDAISRRHVLTLLGASVSLAGLAACRRPEEHIVPYVEAPEQVIPGVPRHYATTMPAGTSAYGLVVESHEGRPTKIEGNELHPATLGSSSARVQAAILDLYDPDRSPFVLRRGERATWADFVAAWQERAKGHAADGGAGLAVLAPPSASPTLFRLAAAFRAAYPRARFVVRDAGRGNERPRRDRSRDRAAPPPGAPPGEGEVPSRDRRRLPERRPGDDPEHPRILGGPARGVPGRRDEPALGGGGPLLRDRGERRSPRCGCPRATSRPSSPPWPSS